MRGNESLERVRFTVSGSRGSKALATFASAGKKLHARSIFMLRARTHEDAFVHGIARASRVCASAVLE